jgi:hypothetical protein
MITKLNIMATIIPGGKATSQEKEKVGWTNYGTECV